MSSSYSKALPETVYQKLRQKARLYSESMCDKLFKKEEYRRDPYGKDRVYQAASPGDHGDFTAGNR
jgi:hypothetical protein